jgi:fatty acid-binding protein DegV
MIRIFTDTTASLTFEEYQKYQIEPVALYVNQGEVSKRELFEMPYDEFYRLQRAGSKFTTSQPSPDDFLKAFRPAVEAGDEIL